MRRLIQWFMHSDEVVRLRARIEQLEADNEAARRLNAAANEYLERAAASFKDATETLARAQELARDVKKTAEAEAVVAAVRLLMNYGQNKPTDAEAERMVAMQRAAMSAQQMIGSSYSYGLGGLGSGLLGALGAAPWKM